MSGKSEDLHNKSMLDLFKGELKSNSEKLSEMLSLIKNKEEITQNRIDEMLRALHTIKGSAKIVNLLHVSELSKGLEEFLPLVLKNKDSSPHSLEVLENCYNALQKILKSDETEISEEKITKNELEELLQATIDLKQGKEEEAKPESPYTPPKESTELDNPVDLNMLGVFIVDLDSQAKKLNQSLLELENEPNNSEIFVELMRTAHSIKGSSRVLGFQILVSLAHAMEDCFQELKTSQKSANSKIIDNFLAVGDVFSTLAKTDAEHFNVELEGLYAKIQEMISALKKIQKGEIVPERVKEEKKKEKPKNASEAGAKPRETDIQKNSRVIRVPADYLTHLMGLAGELVVESRWLNPFSEALQNVKKFQNELAGSIDIFQATIDDKAIGDSGQNLLMSLQRKTNFIRELLAERLEELELFIRRQSMLSDKLYREVITSRMCPFGEGTESFPRLVRDIAKQTKKKVKLEIIGKSTSIDRDILDKLKSPLTHLLRNAVDHGIESPEEREAAGKPAEGLVTLQAVHQAGVLCITLTDDGRGIDEEILKQKIIDKNLADPKMVEQLGFEELFDFLFLPGFSSTDKVTEISGRGIGLNVVQSMVHDVGGNVRIDSAVGKGTTFKLQLPLTLSVIRSLLVKIGGEPYAFPLARIDQAIVINRSKIQLIDNKQYLHFENKNIGLVDASSVLEITPSSVENEDISIVVLNDRFNDYGVIVDSLLGEKELVLQDLDARLGKVQDISSGAFLEDGSPILIIDVDDIMRSIDVYLSGSQTKKNYENDPLDEPADEKKKILIVDDSITVREVQTRILENQGYEVDAAVNGVDGWNTVRIDDYDLVITDIDMPRMNGIELIKLMKNDPRLHDLPVIIVSYKEREEDKRLGMELGAKEYLTKSSFQDDTFVKAVKNIIGE